MAKVLLCDDDVHIVRAAEFKLARAGFEVRCASNGEEGWQHVLAWQPDMVVTDCQMPVLDGFGLCTKIRDNETTRHLPVLMLTAKGFELSHADTREKYGVLAVLAKPFSPRELLRCVQQVIETGRLELAAAQPAAL